MSEIDTMCGCDTKKRQCDFEDYNCYEDVLCPVKARNKIKTLEEKLKEIKTISNTYKGIKEMDEITRIINRRK